ncbi:putative ion transport protein [Penicillium brasilianum]|uniref:Voltage-gated hydrogen channel 1 n=1 Tax=Penicillium brasilianum TaxID=104259 RepID=A0A1S9RX23_PENBI|nr:putative ion transport protein [Penicillium brasilianum]
MRPFFEDHHIRRPLLSLPAEEPLIVRWRRSARDFLNSRWGHYLVLLLVTIDVCCSFSEFLIQLHVCELKQNGYKVGHEWAVIEETLGIAGLVISCLFMVELIVSTLSFGMGYFSTWFHVFDSIVILVAFIIQVSLRGVEEEVGSLVIVLRLWRVFQIIEELKSASEDTMEQYEEEIERLQQENASLRQRLNLNQGGTEDLAGDFS